ncbi:membrane protein, partial [Candidatus Magnetomorum sp. HK-1]
MCCGVAPGTTTPGTAAQLIATGTGQLTVTTTLVFGLFAPQLSTNYVQHSYCWPGRYPVLIFYGANIDSLSVLVAFWIILRKLRLAFFKMEQNVNTPKPNTIKLAPT